MSERRRECEAVQVMASKMIGSFPSAAGRGLLAGNLGQAIGHQFISFFIFGITGTRANHHFFQAGQS